MAKREKEWLERNEQVLHEQLAELKRRLGTAPDKPPPAQRKKATKGEAKLTPLAQLTEAFGLSSFERDILLLAAGLELDPDFADLCAAAQGDQGLQDVFRGQLTFALALAILPNAHWSAVAPGAPLRRWRLVELGAGAATTRATLRIDERILHFLMGLDQIDDRLASLIDITPPVDLDQLAPSQGRIAEQIAETWSETSPSRTLSIVQLSGPPADGPAIASAAAAMLGLSCAALPADRLPHSPQELDGLLRLWERESVLSGLGVLLLTVDDTPREDTARQARDAALTLVLERATSPIVLCEREPRRITWRPSVMLDIGHPTAAEQLALWRDALGEKGPDAVSLASTANQFSLNPLAIRTVADELRVYQAAHPKAEPAATLWDFCRRRLRGALEGLAQRLEANLTWKDLVLPQQQKDTLQSIAIQLRQRATVYEQWGFAAKSRRGLGLSALFHGPSGVGKTMAAEVLASELKLDLYHIDLSRIVSKYIGETETNLRRVFDAAEENGAILLFDEADSLFGARSEVKDSHDRYANIEVSYLLQRMEAYRGLAILTTNMRSALDPAFLRRIRFSVAFPFPEALQREEIWRQVFPKDTPTKNLDPGRLAQLRVAGGNIRNIALNAAFLAAEEGEPVGMNHLQAATRIEYAKLDRRLTQGESAIWA